MNQIHKPQVVVEVVVRVWHLLVKDLVPRGCGSIIAQSRKVNGIIVEMAICKFCKQHLSCKGTNGTDIFRDMQENAYKNMKLPTHLNIPNLVNSLGTFT